MMLKVIKENGTHGSDQIGKDRKNDGTYEEYRVLREKERLRQQDAEEDNTADDYPGHAVNNSSIH